MFLLCQILNYHNYIFLLLWILMPSGIAQSMRQNMLSESSIEAGNFTVAFLLRTTPKSQEEL